MKRNLIVTLACAMLPALSIGQNLNTLSFLKLVATGAFALTLASGQLLAQSSSSSKPSSNGTVTQANGVTVLNVQKQAQNLTSDGTVVYGTVQKQGSVDFVHATPKTLPINPFPTDPTQALVQAVSNVPNLGLSIFSSGSPGTVVNTKSPVFLGKPEPTIQSFQVTPQDYGTNNHPFTTVRADLYNEATNLSYPYSAAGKLFYNEPSGSFMCSASLIKPGVIVTAAHCVANYGAKSILQ